MAELFRLVVLPDDDDPYVVSVDMRTLLKWETKFPGRSFSDIADRTTLGVRDCYELAWLGAQRAKLSVPDNFQTFKEANEVLSIDVFQKLIAQEKAAQEKHPAGTDPEPEPVEVEDDESGDDEPEQEEVSTERDPTQPALSTTP